MADNKKDNIQEIQRYLYNISHFIHTIPSVVPDGIFGKKTENAVRAFQKEYGLPATGEVNRQTYDTIVIVYKHLKESPPDMIDIFPEHDYILSEGSNNDLVYFLQIMLKAINRKFPDIPETEISGLYDTDTVRSVRYIQEKSLFPETGDTDKYTWNNIVKIFHHISK